MDTKRKQTLKKKKLRQKEKLIRVHNILEKVVFYFHLMGQSQEVRHQCGSLEIVGY